MRGSMGTYEGDVRVVFARPERNLASLHTSSGFWFWSEMGTGVSTVRFR